MPQFINRHGFIVVALVLPTLAVAESGLRVTAVADRTEYVLHEPMKLTIGIVNTSSETVRIPQLSRLSMDEMDFIYFEISDPNAAIRRVKSIRARNMYAMTNREYAGAPLAPGDSVQLFYYPVITNVSVDEAGVEAGPAEGSFTFPAPGTYGLRVVYHTRTEYPRLYDGDQHRVWRSNRVRVVIRAPDAVERSILDTLWHCDPAGEGGIGLRREDLGQLETVIDRYPNHPLTRHIRYALGRLRYSESIAETTASATKAIDLLDKLSSSESSFRQEEVRMFLVKSYKNAGRLEEAETTLSALMADHPTLWKNWPFVLLASSLTPYPEQSLKAWMTREVREGAKPVPNGQLRSTWSGD